MDPREYVAKYTAFSEHGAPQTSRQESDRPAPELPTAAFYARQAGQGLETASRPELLRRLRSCLADRAGDSETLADLERTCRERLEQQSSLRGELGALRDENQDLRQRLSLVYASTSWRMTAPLRWAIITLRRAVRRGRTGEPRALTPAGPRRSRKSILEATYGRALYAITSLPRRLLPRGLRSSASLQRRLGSIGPQTHPAVTVIVTDIHGRGQVDWDPSRLGEVLGTPGAEIILAAPLRGGSPSPPVRTLSGSTGSDYAALCNRAVRRARGRWLVFLDCACNLQPGHLGPLLQPLLDRPEVAIACPRIETSQGRLGCAGINLKRNGTLEAVGAGEDAAAPLYGIGRQVDAFSALCFATSRSSYRQVGGLDTGFASADYACADLALRLRRAGYAIAYLPDARVTCDPDAARAACHAEDSTHLLERWNPELTKLDSVRLLCFYLPQFHPIPENDAWWGKGFTEWRNVTKAKPNFPGHYQPQLPADLGFYDLRVPEVRQEQAKLAAEYGVTGFCYFYYWFSGKRLLHRPLDEVISSGEPDFPFCVCWANENWTRRWDGREDDILIAHHYSDQDDIGLMESLLPAFRDERYVRINGRPLFLVYRVERIPDPRAASRRWRDHCRRAGLGNPYIAYVQCFGNTGDPERFGFDAAVEFPPLDLGVPAAPPAEIQNPDFEGVFCDYVATADNFVSKPAAPFSLFRTAMPSWDNTARRQDTGHIFVPPSPQKYGQWLGAIIKETRTLRHGDERLVFVNAWNEWAEGNHLEPDSRFGRAWLEATRDAMQKGLVGGRPDGAP